MSGHVPPPGAAEAVEKAALDYLVTVQRALGTSHKQSVLKVSMLALLKVASEFGIGFADRFSIVREVERLTSGGS